jgi:hypothetical protein
VASSQGTKRGWRPKEQSTALGDEQERDDNGCGHDLEQVEAQVDHPSSLLRPTPPEARAPAVPTARISGFSIDGKTSMRRRRFAAQAREAAGAAEIRRPSKRRRRGGLSVRSPVKNG